MNSTLVSFLSLAALSVVYISAVSGIERLRMAVSRMQASTMLGVFTFAGVVILPWHYLLTLIGLIYITIWPTFKRAGAKAHRHAYTGLSVALASWAASVVYTASGEGLAGIVASMATFTILNAGTIALVIAIARHHQSWPMFRRPSLYGVMTASMSLGALVGYAIQWHAVAGYAGLPVIFAVHLRAARQTVEETGACIGGVWNRTGWLALAEEARRMGDRMSVVLVELPDAHEMNVATEIVQARFGAEPVGVYAATQLVILLQEAEGPAARYLALRLTVALDKAGLHAGVGCADSQGGSVAGMLAAAAGEAIICRSLDDSDSELR